MTISAFFHSIEYKTLTLSSLFLLMGIFFLFFSKKLYGDYFSPIGLMGSMWNWAIAIAHLQLSDVYQRAWTIKTWFVVSGSFTAFSIGCLTVTFLFFKENKRRPFKRWSNNTLKLTISKERLKKTIYFIFFASYIATIYQVLRVIKIGGGLDVFSRPRIFENNFWVTGVGYIYFLNFFNPLLCLIYLKLYGSRNSKNIIMILILSILAWPLRMNKTVIFIGFAGLFFLSNYIRRKPLALRHFMLVLLALAILFVTYSKFSGYMNVEYVVQDDIKLPQKLALIARPYLYLATSFENLQEAILQGERGIGFPGVRTFYPLINFSFSNDLFNVWEKLRANRPMFNKQFKTNTYLGHYYLDFGTVGTIIVPYLIGLITTFIYLKLLRKGTIWIVFAYPYIAYATAFSFFFCYYSHSPIWYMIFMSIFTAGIIKRKGAVVKP